LKQHHSSPRRDHTACQHRDSITQHGRSLRYGGCEFLFENTYVSLLTCYIFNFFLTFVRTRWGAINLSRKTLIDKRFLI
jgi:hypothetical protein